MKIVVIAIIVLTLVVWLLPAIPVSLLGGAAYMMIVDMLARSLAPNEIPLSVITGIIGTPLFLISIFKRRKELL